LSQDAAEILVMGPQQQVEEFAIASQKAVTDASLDAELH
jgi:hypothetical protein